MQDAYYDNAGNEYISNGDGTFTGKSGVIVKAGPDGVIPVQGKLKIGINQDKIPQIYLIAGIGCIIFGIGLVIYLTEIK